MKSFLVLVAFFVFQYSFAQEMTCVEGRYQSEIFADYTMTTIQYGQNIDALQQNKNLMMDVYTPNDDSQPERPLMIVAHGGSFVSGVRQDMDRFCVELVKKGFVCATIDYRLWPFLFLGFPDSAKIAKTAIGAMSDMKAAVRFFRKSYEEGNPFGIDTNYIAVGGGSAGAITAVHIAYMDQSDDIQEDLLSEIELQGGFEGNSGDSINLTYPSHVHSVYNLSGAIFDTSFIQAGDVPIFSIQGTADDVVPYSLGKAANLVTMMGSELIHRRAENLNITNLLVSVEEGGHSNIYDEEIYAEDLDSYERAISSYWANLICGITSSSQSLGVVQQLSSYPNPFRSHTQITIPQGHKVKSAKMISVDGKIHLLPTGNSSPHIHISRPSAPGIYMVIVVTDKGHFTTKLVVE